MAIPSSNTAETVLLAKELAAWLRHAGVEQTDLAVDIADLLAAAKHIDSNVRSLLTLDLGNQKDAEAAAEKVGEMEVWLFTEMKPHLENLESGWQAVEDAVFGRLPEDD